MILTKIWIHLYSKTWTNMQIHLYELMDENKCLKIFIRFEEKKQYLNQFEWWILHKWISEHICIFKFLRFYHFSFLALQDGGGMGTSWGRRQHSSFPVFLQMQHCISCKSYIFISSKMWPSQSSFISQNIKLYLISPSYFFAL